VVNDCVASASASRPETTGELVVCNPDGIDRTGCGWFGGTPTACSALCMDTKTAPLGSFLGGSFGVPSAGSADFARLVSGSSEGGTGCAAPLVLMRSGDALAKEKSWTTPPRIALARFGIRGIGLAEVETANDGVAGLESANVGVAGAAMGSVRVDGMLSDVSVGATLVADVCEGLVAEFTVASGAFATTTGKHGMAETCSGIALGAAGKTVVGKMGVDRIGVSKTGVAKPVAGRFEAVGGLFFP
jgi:hypothetical protein